MISQEIPRSVSHIILAEKILQKTDILYTRLRENCGVSKLQAPDWMREVIRFLHLIAHYNERLTPSIDVDNVWHEFILCTKSYMDFCESQFGRFIHHHPGGNHKENLTQYQRTLELYKSHFGPPRALYWGGLNVTNPEAGCGPCEAS